MTVQKFLQEQALNHRRPNTISTDKTILNMLNTWRDVDSIDAEGLKDYIHEYKAQFKKNHGKEPQESNINIRYSVFKKYYEFMKRPDVIVWIKTRKIVKKLNPNKLLSSAEVQTMLRISESTRDKAFLAMMYETGMRRGELLSLSLEDVNIVDGECFIRIPDNSEASDIQAKTGSRSLVMVEYVDYIERYLAVFKGTKTDRLFLFHKSNANLIINSMAKKAGIDKRVYPHLLRHTRATELAKLGMQETSMKRRFGWAEDSSQIKRYTSLTDDDADNSYRVAIGAATSKERNNKLKHCAKCGKVVVEGDYCAQCSEIQKLTEANTKASLKLAEMEQQHQNFEKMMADMIERRIADRVNEIKGGK